jgi:hypothetical protein
MKLLFVSLLAALTLGTASCKKGQHDLPPDGTTNDPASGKTKPYMTITTIAGTDTKKGFADGKGTASQFSYPSQMAIDKNDNLYVIDQRTGYEGGSVIRKIDPSGNVQTFASGMTAVTDLCIDPRDGVTIYAVENGNSFGVRSGLYRITSSGQVMRLSYNGDKFRGYQDGPLSSALFDSPISITMDSKGNLYVGDALNRLIRKVDLTTNMVTTYAGHYSADAVCQSVDGKNSDAEFCSLWDLTIDESGNLYVPDWGNHAVRKVTPNSTSTFIPLSTGYKPDAPRTATGVYQPYRIHYDMNSKQMLIVTGTGGSLKLLGTDDYLYNATGHIVKDDFADVSPGSQHSLESAVMNKKGEILWVDKNNHCLRKGTILWK